MCIRDRGSTDDFIFLTIVSPVTAASEVGFQLTGLKHMLGGGRLEVVYDKACIGKFQVKGLDKGTFC